MPRITRRSVQIRAPVIESSDDESVFTPKPRHKKNTKSEGKPLPEKDTTNKIDSSSESDLETFLKPADQIDLNSSFFDVDKYQKDGEFDAIEKTIFAGVNRLSDSESESDNNHEEKSQATAPTVAKSNTNKINFQQLYDYTKKIEEAKQVVEKYEAKKKAKFKKNKRKKDTKETSISDLLAKGETKVESVHNSSKSLHSSDYESFSDSEKDWEEVEEHHLKEKKETIVPKHGVEITVQLPGVMHKKKGVDLIASMKRRLNSIRKENQVYIHKVHLLCWIAHGNYVNTILNGEHLLALAMSLLPSQHCYPPERTNLSYLEAVVKWFSNAIPVTDKIVSKTLPLDKALRFQINRKVAYNKKMLVYIFICMLRALGIQCRLILSFVLSPLRPPTEELHSLSTKSNDSKPKTEQKKSSTPSTSSSDKKESTNQSRNKRLTPSSTVTVTSQTENINNKNKIKQTSKNKNDKIKEGSHKKNTDTKKPAPPNKKEEPPVLKKKSNSSDYKTKTKKDVSSKASKTEKPNLKKLSDHSKKGSSKSSRLKADKEKIQIPQLDGANDSDSGPKKRTQKPDLKKLSQEQTSSCPKKHPKRLKTVPNYADQDSDDDFKPQVPIRTKQQSKVNLQKLKQSQSSTTVKNDIRNDIISIMKGRMAEERSSVKTKLVKRKSNSNASDYDSDYAPEPVKKKHHDSDDEFYEKTKVKVKRRVQVKPEANSDETKKRKGVNVWVEVYLENEEKWISVDVTKGEIHCTKQLYSRASHPVTYVVAWNNNNTIKDLTQRYCPNWNTVTRKLRIDKKWWDVTLKPFVGLKTARDKEEDEELARLQLDQPLPKTINEFKDHPLYVLKRHLLKFQALYPADSVILGFVRTEPVYSRDCVHTLHSRETWLKHAKVVKLGEKPYKIVKARPKYDKLSGQVITDLQLEVFGKWQVEDYIPPTAKDGIVPRNAYGNVELFKACMLPKGTVHLQLPGLNKVAKKMNIDCVPAVVGFDIHSGWTHPTFDGFVVCEEFSEGLIAAWYLEQEEQEKREEEKIEKRVYGNWKRLIKGLLIRERLKARYDYGVPSQDDNKTNKKKRSKSSKLASKKRRLCSESE